MRLPKKYRGDGRHVYCTQCRGTITNHFDRDAVIKSKKGKCTHDEKHHVFYSLPYSKVHKKVVSGTAKAWPEIKDPQEFFDAHIDYHKQLKARNYGMQTVKKRLLPSSLLLDCQGYYLDFKKNDPRIVPVSQRKKISPKQVGEIKKRIKTFNDVLRMKGVNPSAANVDIPSEWADWFYEYLTNYRDAKTGKSYANKTFNHYISALSGFYEKMIKLGKVEVNHFADITQRRAAKDTRIITDEELSVFLPKIKEIYGKGIDGRNYYDEDLKFAILLGLWTGGRGEELFELKGNALNGNFWIIKKSKESNMQEQEWSTSEDSEYREEFVTEDCRRYLESRGLPRLDEYFIKPEWKNRKSLQDKFSRAFTHFWTISANEDKKEWKHLRKTFFTRKSILMQELGQYLPSHKNQATLIGHYINHKAIIEEKMAGRAMYKLS